MISIPRITPREIPTVSKLIHYHLLTSGLRTYSGGRPLYRSREWEAEERQQKKILKKTSWYRSRADVPVFFPATPQGVLAKNIQKVIDEEQVRLGMRVKVMEKGGVSVAAQLFKPEVSQASCGAIWTGPRAGGEDTTTGQGVCTRAHATFVLVMA